ncbi:MAG: hypothetical protein ABSF26_28940 [Thermoguttaceae bacterium]
MLAPTWPAGRALVAFAQSRAGRPTGANTAANAGLPWPVAGAAGLVVAGAALGKAAPTAALGRPW